MIYSMLKGEAEKGQAKMDIYGGIGYEKDAGRQSDRTQIEVTIRYFPSVIEGFPWRNINQDGRRLVSNLDPPKCESKAILTELRLFGELF